jgi:multicomponent Na+:H+ antiporter subunit E
MKTTEPSSQSSPRSQLAEILTVALAMVFCWTAFAGGDLGSWLIGVPAVLGAVWVRRWLAPLSAQSICLKRIPGFFLNFLLLSLWAGIDVGARAIAPKIRVNPGLLTYPLRLPRGPARLFFMWVITLIPGTLTADLQSGRLLVHVIDKEGDNQAELIDLENQVAALFGLVLPEFPIGPNGRIDPTVATECSPAPTVALPTITPVSSGAASTADALSGKDSV